MTANCGVCGSVCSDTKTALKCGGVCGKWFHMQCVKLDGVKTRQGNKEWKCEECLKTKDPSAVSNKPSASSSTLTNEILVKILEEFKKEVFSELKKQSKQINEFKDSLEFLSRSVEEVGGFMTEFKKEFAELKKQNDELYCEKVKLTETVDNLTMRVRELEQYSRKCNIEINGIPATPKEDTLSLVKDVGAAIGLQTEDEHVMAAHRVPSYNTRREPGIVVQFQNRLLRDKWLSSFKTKKTLTANEVNPLLPSNRVYINEHLCPENKQFLSQLKLKCKEIGFKYVWFREGKFFIRKSDGEKCHRITKLQEINKFS
jgi:archaellum component FlaC